jgi:23S rRNA (pseudouridine1915-N3)-methyltransferase
MPRTGLTALDLNGKQMTSRSLAAELCRARDQGSANDAFASAARTVWSLPFLASASLTLSFGAMAWPDQLIRMMAADPATPRHRE